MTFNKFDYMMLNINLSFIIPNPHLYIDNTLFGIPFSFSSCKSTGGCYGFYSIRTEALKLVVLSCKTSPILRPILGTFYFINYLPLLDCFCGVETSISGSG